MPTPCAKCPKAEDGKAAPEKELSDKNWEAFRHFYECRATFRFPNDPIVRRNAAIILHIMEASQRSTEQALPAIMVALLGARK
jgi:hypothetical protein